MHRCPAFMMNKVVSIVENEEIKFCKSRKYHYRYRCIREHDLFDGWTLPGVIGAGQTADDGKSSPCTSWKESSGWLKRPWVW